MKDKTGFFFKVFLIHVNRVSCKKPVSFFKDRFLQSFSPENVHLIENVAEMPRNVKWKTLSRLYELLAVVDNC